MTQQLMITLGFDGSGTVRSVYAPYRCARCAGETLRLISFDSSEYLAAISGSVPCPACGAAMELDDLPENYELLAQTYARAKGHVGG
jgi:hypothetical protein